MNDFCVVVNTNSAYKDIWSMFFNQLEFHLPGLKVYVFTDIEIPLINKNYIQVFYDNSLDFRTQYLNCLMHVKERCCLNMNDDYVLYQSADLQKLNSLKNILLSDCAISCIRVSRGYNHSAHLYSDCLYWLDPDMNYFYSQTVTIWKTNVLLDIHQNTPPSSIARKDNLAQLEVLANTTCKLMNVNGLYHYDNEPKRGAYHYDSNIFPYIASALVGGKWNFKEYKKELGVLLNKYDINPCLRGVH